MTSGRILKRMAVQYLDKRLREERSGNDINFQLGLLNNQSRYDGRKEGGRLNTQVPGSTVIGGQFQSNRRWYGASWTGNRKFVR